MDLCFFVSVIRVSLYVSQAVHHRWCQCLQSLMRDRRQEQVDSERRSVEVHGCFTSLSPLGSVFNRSDHYM